MGATVVPPVTDLRLWERFQSGACSPQEIDGSLALRRWARCRDAGHSAENPGEPRMALAGLPAARDRFAPLLAPGAPFDAFATTIARAGFCGLFCDSDGLVIARRIAEPFEASIVETRLIEGALWSESARGTNGVGPINSWLDFPLYERCITRGIGGSILRVIYGNGNRIVQAPGMVAITYEMIHDTRVIPLNDTRPRLSPHIKLWMGDARGRWEGDTLVVDTRNFTDLDKHWVDQGIPASKDFRMIERYRLINNGNTLEGEWTLIDPQNWEGEWKGTRRWNRVNDHDIQEVECLPDLNEHLQSTSSSVHVR